MFEELGQDLRYALRALRSSPGFTATALLTLALGIGANTAIFSVTRGVLLEPLPFPQSERLVRAWQVHRANGIERGALSEPDFNDWRAASTLAQSIGGYFYMEGGMGVDLTGDGNPERISTALITDGFFETLRTPAFIGRTLGPDEQVEGRNRAVVLSHGMWLRRFGGDGSIVGRSLTLNGQPFVVLGVMPRGFTYPDAQSIDAWIPLSFFGPDDIGRARNAHFIQTIARLKPGVTEAQLRNELAGIAARLSREYPHNPGWDDASTSSLRESMLGEVSRPLFVLMVAVAMLLLIACVNIASLLLARASGRQRELAVRAALGAGRGRIARQLLTESLTLAVLGGMLGVGLAYVAVRALGTFGATELPRSGDIRIDGVVLAFTVGVSLLSGLLFGLMPTLRASSGQLERSLRSGTRGSIGSTGQRLRSALVIVEVALAVVLVVGAGLATKSFGRLTSIKPGFEPSNALVVTISVPEGYFDKGIAAVQNYYQTVLESVRRIPGVQAAGSARDLPLRGNGEMFNVIPPGGIAASGENPTAYLHHISTDYFKALGTPLRAGRSVENSDRGGTPAVLVVNEELQRRFWPGESAVGKQLRTTSRGNYEIVGVVGDIRQRGLADAVEPMAYIHALQNFRSRMNIVVRTTGDPLSYANAVRQAIWSVDAEQTIAGVTTLDAVLGRAVSRPRLLAWLLALFGVIGLTLGALGIFGVLAYAVTQRRQEIGVRVALGATPRSVLSMIVGRGMALASIGVVLGLVGAALLTRFMQTVLYDIRPSDPSTFAQVVVVLLGASLLASWLPARRALAIDPVNALRYD